MSSVDITNIKHAINTWVRRGSGLAANKVIWTLGARVPDGTYIHLRARVGTIGSDLVRVTPAPTPSSGQDALYTVVGGRLLTLTMTCFAPETPDQATRAPEQILNDVLTALSLPSVNDVIQAAKLGAMKFGDVQTIDLNINHTLFEPRATCTVRFHTIASLSETGPAIDSTEISGDTPSGDLDFIVSF